MPTATKLEVLRVPALGSPNKVDREKQIIYGVILAQEGPFKSEGRGEFDARSIETIRKLISESPNGAKCRLAHPDESHDGVDKTLGRFRDPRVDTITARDSEGTLKTNPVKCVRADLHINPAADKGPFKMGDYVMTLAETDPDILSTSLVLRTEKEYRLNPNGTPMLDANGDELPPLWRPTQIMACDVVSTGDACDGLLAKMGGDGESLGALPNGVVFQAVDALDKQFAGKPRDYVEEHCRGFLDRYLARRYGLAADTGEPDGAAGGPQESLLEVLAILRAQQWLYHTAHWQTSGPAFYGQHLLFARLYDGLTDQYDALAEKIVGLFGPAAVNGLVAVQLAASYVALWSGPDAVAAGLTSETALSEHIAEALAATVDNVGMQNFLQGLADQHQTNVYLLQQVQGGKKPEDALATRPIYGISRLAGAREIFNAFARQFRLAMGEDAGEPGGEEIPATEPGPDPNHDGCRSRHAYHSEVQCSCGVLLESCGCRDRHLESRVVRVRLNACPACIAAKETAEKDGMPSTGDAIPDATDPGATDPAGDDPQYALRKRRLALMELE